MGEEAKVVAKMSLSVGPGEIRNLKTNLHDNSLSLLQYITIIQEQGEYPELPLFRCYDRPAGERVLSYFWESC